jgi:hypothetical protein
MKIPFLRTGRDADKCPSYRRILLNMKFCLKVYSSHALEGRTVNTSNRFVPWKENLVGHRAAQGRAPRLYCTCKRHLLTARVRPKSCIIKFGLTSTS